MSLPSLEHLRALGEPVEAKLFGFKSVDVLGREPTEQRRLGAIVLSGVSSEREIREIPNAMLPSDAPILRAAPTALGSPGHRVVYVARASDEPRLGPCSHCVAGMAVCPSPPCLGAGSWLEGGSEGTRSVTCRGCGGSGTVRCLKCGGTGTMLTMWATRIEDRVAPFHRLFLPAAIPPRLVDPLLGALERPLEPDRAWLLGAPTAHYRTADARELHETELDEFLGFETAGPWKEARVALKSFRARSPDAPIAVFVWPLLYVRWSVIGPDAEVLVMRHAREPRFVVVSPHARR